MEYKITVKQAMDRLKHAMHEEYGPGSYRDSWLANIAMPIYDNQTSKYRLGHDLSDPIGCNLMADDLLNHFFGTKKQYAEWLEEPEEPEESECIKEVEKISLNPNDILVVSVVKFTSSEDKRKDYMDSVGKLLEERLGRYGMDNEVWVIPEELKLSKIERLK